jgi:hypothetical protein
MPALWRSSEDMLTEAGELLVQIVRHVGAEGELTAYGEPGTASYVLGCARILHRRSHTERPVDPGPATVEIR